MKRARLVVALGTALAMGTGLMVAAQAMPISQLQDSNAGLLQKTQFIFGNRHYCFYLNGWHGPGWYWCGYASRRGLGWGGPRGWHGWHHGGPGPRGPMHRGPMRHGPMGHHGGGHHHDHH
ncbi:MAG: hypothetical protein ACRECL_00110 [Bradyrhizobium sp.]